MKHLKIRYNNTNKGELSDKEILIMSESPPNSIRQCLDVTGMTEEDIAEIKKLNEEYQEKYYKNIPTLKNYVEKERKSKLKIKYRKYLKANTEILVEK